MSKRSCSPTFSLQRIVVRPVRVPVPAKQDILDLRTSNLEPRTTTPYLVFEVFLKVSQSYFSLFNE
jgi:hypothetical protein